jgi:hypothetical protein
MLKKKIVLYIAIPLLIIILVIGILVNLILYKGNIMVFKVNPSVNTVSKALSVEKTGGTLQLKQEDLNGILEFYLTKSIKNSNIKGIYSILDKSEIELYIPASYKNINFLLYTKGKLSYQDKKINFEPSSFKVGRINLSVKFVMEKLQKYFKNENIMVNNSTISINSDLIPFDFTSLTMKDNLLEAGIAKVVNPVVGQAPTPSNQPSAVVDQNKALLIKASNQLNGVYSSASTEAEKQIVSSMRSVIGKMINNSNYPYKTEADQTKANYSKLSQSEKDDLKNAMMDNMDMQTVKKLKATFGF